MCGTNGKEMELRYEKEKNQKEVWQEKIRQVQLKKARSYDSNTRVEITRNCGLGDRCGRGGGSFNSQDVRCQAYRGRGLFQ